ncbi:MAG: glycosyltransferase family 4 protein [Promethearchaeota archaeon]|jgi:glycosyltransferase involved in cell wall biosynthesis
MLAPEFLPVWGGVGTYIVELVRHLPKNIEIHVVTPKRESFGNEKISVLNSYNSGYFGKNIIVHYISKANDTFFYNATFQYACLKYVPKLLKEEKIDLIHSHTAHMPDLLLMLRRLSVPTITTVHTTIKSQRLGTKLSKRSFFDLERSEKITYLMYPFLRMTEIIYFKQKRYYISPSKWMKRSLARSFHINKNVMIIPNSVDMADFPQHKYTGFVKKLIQTDFYNKKIILYVGRLIAMKGVDAFIDSIATIITKTDSKDLIFVFAGPGDQIRYRNKVKLLNISDRCFFTGPLPKNQVVQLISASTLVVLPSYIENMPYTVLESMACGIPIVANNVGGISEIINNGYNGKLIDSNSPKVIAAAIISLLQDESLRSSIGKHAKDTISNKFSWTVNINKYNKFYSDVVNQ